MATVRFLKYNCLVELQHYVNGRIAIRLTNADVITDDGYPISPGMETIAIATINIPEAPVPDNHVIIKDYSENQGMYQTLLDAGIIGKKIADLQHGFVTSYICPLLIPITDE